MKSVYKHCINTITLLTAGLLVACGGGGDSSSSNNNDTNPTQSDTDTPYQVLSLPVTEVNRENSSSFFMALYEYRVLGVQLALSLDLHNLVPSFDQSQNRDQPSACAGGGQKRLVVTNDGKNIKQTFTDCVDFDQITYTGSLEYTITDVDILSYFSARTRFVDFKQTYGDNNITMNGDVDFEVSTLGLQDPEATINIEVNDTRHGTLVAKSLSFAISPDYHSHIANRSYRVSGQIGYDAQGMVNVAPGETSNLINVTGTNDTKMVIADDDEYAGIEFYPSQTTAPEAGVRILHSTIDESGVFIYTGQNLPPAAIATSDYQDYDVDPHTYSYFSTQYIGVEGSAYTFDVLGTITDANADPLNYHVEVEQVFAVDERGNSKGEVINPDDFTIERLSYSRFQLVAETPGQYVIAVTGTDITDSMSDKQIARITIVADTDRDGFFDSDDPDDDNDGVNDYQDALPKDPTETSDFDRDGIGDNADPNDDNDAVADQDDHYPFNAKCSYAYEGDGTNCYIELISNRKILFDYQGVLYFYNPGSNDIARWDVNAQSFIEPLNVGQVLDTDDQLNTAVYVSKQERLYLGFASGNITYIDISIPDTELFFVDSGDSVQHLIDADNFLLVFHEHEIYPSRADIKVYDGNGVHTSSNTGDMPGYNRDYRSSYIPFSRAYVHDAAQDLYYDAFNEYDDNDNDDLDLTTGGMIAEQDKIESAPVVHSPDLLLSLRANGQVVNLVDDTVVSQLNGVDTRGFPRGLIAWTDDGISYLKNRQYVRINPQGEVQEQYSVPGDGLISLFAYDNQLIAVTYDYSPDEMTHITVITPSDDTDNDGVNNLVDAYPNDPAASLDNDHDGYPDSWNPGFDEMDSTQSLTLDAYPGAIDCYLPEHGNGTECDPASTIGYTANSHKEIALANDDTILMMLGQRIYRYSLTLESFLPSLFIGEDDPYKDYQARPSLFTYSATENRIYLAYVDHITFIDLDETLQEQHFTEVDEEISTISVTDDYFIVGVNDLDVARYFFDHTGALVQQSKKPYRVENLAWDALTNKLYTSHWPNDIYIEDLDPGEFTGEATLLGYIDGSGPLFKLSPDGQYFIRNNGNIYNTADASLNTTVTGYVYDAVWLASGELVTANHGRLMRYGADFTLIEEREIGSFPKAVFEWGNKIVVVVSTTYDTEFVIIEFD